MEYLFNLDPVIQALIATLFTYAVTALGAAIVFFFKKVNKSIMDAMLGFAAGVMVAASFFSLISPALEHAESLGQNKALICTIGFLLGGIVLFIGDKIYTHLDKKKGIKSNSLKRCFLLVFSITLHNFPEGLAVGIAFGSAGLGIEGATFISACILALGIGIQNFPEGSSVSLPLKREGFSNKKAFFYGQLSGIVEPIAGVLGALLVIKIRVLLPLMLSFAAGAMIYVVIEELVPESQTNKRKDLMALSSLIGFCVMMILDIALG